MVKKIALLGATGSIGTSTFKVLREQNQHLQITLAAAFSNHTKLCPLALEFKIPTLVFTGIADAATQNRIRQDYPGLKICFGQEELLKALDDVDYDIGLNAIGGSNGIEASFKILKRGKKLALANKESLVLGGHLLEAYRKQMIPVDSEHSAIFQAIGAHPLSEIRRIVLTASGGAFRDFPLKNFDKITPAMALKHPNWDMGAKVTIDSATMFNKALEVMEAHWLFGLPYTNIEAIIHPQSIIHSLVEFIDGSHLAQLSFPDMKIPILYALSHPRRYESHLVKTELLAQPRLDFKAIEPERYPLFYLGLEAASAGGIMPTVINAAVEAAMQLFLARKISFTDIYGLAQKTLDKAEQIPNPSLEEILWANRFYHAQCLDFYDNRR